MKLIQLEIWKLKKIIIQLTGVVDYTNIINLLRKGKKTKNTSVARGWPQKNRSIAIIVGFVKIVRPKKHLFKPFAKSKESIFNYMV
jgi:hypothetical protein